MDSVHLFALGMSFLILYFSSKTVIHYINSKKESKTEDKLFGVIDTLAKKIPEIQYMKDDSELLKDKIWTLSVSKSPANEVSLLLLFELIPLREFPQRKKVWLKNH